MVESWRKRGIHAARRFLPASLNDWAVRQIRRYRLQSVKAGSVNFGDLRRVRPISGIFGLDRGQPIDRYYIDRFLETFAADIRGQCLEMGDATYIRKFGGDRVTGIDVLHLTQGNPEATIVGDLTTADHIPSNRFDCIVFTQTLQMIYDLGSALQTLNRILRPGGVLLLTSHGISRISRRLGRDDWGEYWHLTTQSLARLVGENFPGADAEILSYGNVLSSVAYLHGLAAEELSPAELDAVDSDFELLIAARVCRP